jgi:predicted transcriptional regulator
MPKDGTAVEKCSLTVRTNETMRGSLAGIAEAIDRDVTYVHRALLMFGVEKFSRKPQDLSAFMLRRKRKNKKKV